MNFSAKKTEQFSKRTFVFLKITFDVVTWKKFGIDNSFSTGIHEAKETRLFILLRKSPVTGDPLFETKSQICFVVRYEKYFWLN